MTRTIDTDLETHENKTFGERILEGLSTAVKWGGGMAAVGVVVTGAYFVLRDFVNENIVSPEKYFNQNLIAYWGELVESEPSQNYEDGGNGK